MNDSLKDFIELSTKRYSCRSYDCRPLPAETVNTILEAARLAPSACNKQPWHFYVVTDADKRKRLLSKSRPVFADAPVLVVAVGNHPEAWHRPSDRKDHTDVDVSIAVEHICLAAASAGVGSCWICSFDTEGASDVLGLDQDHEPIAMIPLGYPAEGTSAPEKKRKSFDEVVTWVD